MKLLFLHLLQKLQGVLLVPHRRIGIPGAKRPSVSLGCPEPSGSRLGSRECHQPAISRNQTHSLPLTSFAQVGPGGKTLKTPPPPRIIFSSRQHDAGVADLRRLHGLLAHLQQELLAWTHIESWTSPKWKLFRLAPLGFLWAFPTKNGRTTQQTNPAHLWNLFSVSRLRLHVQAKPNVDLPGCWIPIHPLHPQCQPPGQATVARVASLRVGIDHRLTNKDGNGWQR